MSKLTIVDDFAGRDNVVMINVTNERLEFENIMRKNGFPDDHLRKDRRGHYLRKNVESAFQGWILKTSQVLKSDQIGVHNG